MIYPVNRGKKMSKIITGDLLANDDGCIHIYTREEAIEGGVLADVSEMAPDLLRMFFHV
jgi:hypothetical protein